MYLTNNVIVKTAKEIGVSVEIHDNPTIPCCMDFYIKGDPIKRKKMIAFLEGWRHYGMVYKYHELDK